MTGLPEGYDGALEGAVKEFEKGRAAPNTLSLIRSLASSKVHGEPEHPERLTRREVSCSRHRPPRAGGTGVTVHRARRRTLLHTATVRS